MRFMLRRWAECTLGTLEFVVSTHANSSRREVGGVHLRHGSLDQSRTALLSLSILVVLHEFGHYWAARAFKTRVEKFYLFMNPGSRSSRSKSEKRNGALAGPLGGYVKSQA